MRKPIPWATNNEYGVGHGIYTGTATKIQPSGAVAADGHVPDEAVGMQHLNATQNANSDVSDAVWGSGHLGFTEQSATDGVVHSAAQGPNGLYFYCAGSTINLGSLFLLGHSNETPVDVTPPGVTRAYGIAWNETGRMVCVGFAAGAFAAYSDNYGVTWTTVVTYTGENFRHVVWDSGNSLFIATGTTTHIATSPDGITWTTRTPGTATDADSLITSGGTTIRAWGDGTSTAKVDVSTDGISWTTYSLPAVGSIAQVLGLGVDPSNEKFICMIGDTSGGDLEIYSSLLTDGTVWIKEGEQLVSAGESFIDGNTVLNIGVCDSTGVIYVGVQNARSPYHGITYSADLGASWGFVPLRYLGVLSSSDEAYVSVAGDRLFFGSDDSSSTGSNFTSNIF